MSRQFITIYDDDTLMTFGRYKDCKLEDVPDYYLRWVYNESGTKDKELLKYIKENIENL